MQWTTALVGQWAGQLRAYKRFMFRAGRCSKDVALPDEINRIDPEILITTTVLTPAQETVLK